MKPVVINERAAVLLRQLVDSYLSNGQPVGSKQLAQDAGLKISPATIRNVMSGLEKKGLVVAPHTSAGRIPTEQGLRLFVDSLLEIQPLAKGLQKKLESRFDPDLDASELLSIASQTVSRLTRMAGVVTVPRHSQARLRHIEFLPLSDKRILAIMVTNEKDVQNRVVHVNREYSSSELQMAANFLNQHFLGEDVQQIRQRLLQDLENARQHIDQVMKTAIEVAGEAFQENRPEAPEYIVQGEKNLVRYEYVSGQDQLKQLFDIFDRKREMLCLFDRCIQSEGVKIFIGKETGFDGLDDCSVITAPYNADGKVVGVLGVIGPSRMNYDRVIPVVDMTARLLGNSLK